MCQDNTSEEDCRNDHAVKKAGTFATVVYHAKGSGVPLLRVGRGGRGLHAPLLGLLPHLPWEESFPKGARGTQEATNLVAQTMCDGCRVEFSSY